MNNDLYVWKGCCCFSLLFSLFAISTINECSHANVKHEVQSGAGGGRQLLSPVASESIVVHKNVKAHNLDLINWVFNFMNNLNLSSSASRLRSRGLRIRVFSFWSSGIKCNNHVLTEPINPVTPLERLLWTFIHHFQGICLVVWSQNTVLLFWRLKDLEQVWCRCEAHKQRSHLSEPCDWSGCFMMWFAIKGAPCPLRHVNICLECCKCVGSQCYFWLQNLQT